MDIEESQGCASRGRAQRLIEMRIKRLPNDMRVVTHFTAQQSFPNEHVDFCFAQLDHQAAQAMPLALPM
jgi:hypothetical protein